MKVWVESDFLPLGFLGINIINKLASGPFSAVLSDDDDDDYYSMRRFALPIFIALARSNDAFAPKRSRKMRRITIYNKIETTTATTTNVLDVSTLETLPPTALTNLRSQSLAIVRDFLPPELVRQLRRDVEALRRDGPVSQAAAAEHGSVDWFELLPSRPFSPDGNSNHGRESLYALVEDLRTAIEGTMNVKIDAHLTELKYAYYVR